MNVGLIGFCVTEFNYLWHLLNRNFWHLVTSCRGAGKWNSNDLNAYNDNFKGFLIILLES